jgi:hypothetical protein
MVRNVMGNCWADCPCSANDRCTARLFKEGSISEQSRSMEARKHSFDDATTLITASASAQADTQFQHGNRVQGEKAGAGYRVSHRMLAQEAEGAGGRLNKLSELQQPSVPSG